MSSAPPPPEGWYHVNSLANLLGIGRDWITARLDKSQFQPVLGEQKGHSLAYYSPECYAWLRGEAAAWKSVPEMGKNLSLQQVADRLGVTVRYVESQCLAHGLPIRPRRSRNNRVVKTLSLISFRQLKALQVELAPMDMYNVHQLMLATGWPIDTVRNRLKRSGIQWTEYRSGETGQVHKYYPAESVGILGMKSNAHPPAGQWLSANRMANQLGRSYRWITPRLARYAIVSRILRNDSGSATRHYPPSVYHELALLSEAERSASSAA